MLNTTSILTDQPPEAPNISAESNSIQTSTVLGVRFDCVGIGETVKILSRFIVEKKPRQICLANAYTVALAHKDAALNRLLNESDLVLADGMSIVWAGRWVGAILPGRVGGPDLMEALCEEATHKNHRIFLLGSTDENLDDLAHVLKTEFSQIQIAGTYSPPFCERLTDTETNKIMELLKVSKTDILFVSMSAPKQERWISENLHRLPVPVNIGVGAAFDFLSGKIPRAPLWMQNSGLEWAYRLYREPRRLWKRYLLGNFVFLFSLILQMVKVKFSRPSRSTD